jgi:hypothetical protein
LALLTSSPPLQVLQNDLIFQHGILVSNGLMLHGPIFGGFVNSLNETETMYESVGESDKRIAENLVGTETMVVLIGGAVVFYGSICYMAFTLTQVQKA